MKKITYTPEILNIVYEADLKRYNEILKIPGLMVHDEIEGQVAELYDIFFPSESDKRVDQIEQFFMNLREGRTAKEYGLWVYYSWNNEMVHILPEEDFIRVRTSRNKYKITEKEQGILAEKKVAVVGLSVGKSVAITMAMERALGVLVLADFDQFELSNSNRIITPLKNLGVPKATIVAREIMEIDPFISIEVFENGVTHNNVSDFFEVHGGLDLVIDECDSVDIKYLIRFEGKKRGVPILMEMSDRCMIDVERFDLEPDRPVLHGLVGEVDMQALSQLKTSEEKIPYLIPMLGLETLSMRLRASALEIGQTIPTWPQLASAVVMGGGVMADLTRKILLGQYNDSGRYYIDLDEIFPVVKNTHASSAIDNGNTPSKFEWIDLEQLETFQKELSTEVVDEVVQAACHAPSGGNWQPWRWSYHNGKLILQMSLENSSELLDTNNIASLIACGCSIENADLAARSKGYKIVLLSQIGQGSNAVWEFEFTKLEVGLSHQDKYLAPSIYSREVNRNIESYKKIDSSILENLKQFLKHGSDLQLIWERDQIEKISRIVAKAEQLRLLNRTGHKNFVDELRWTHEEARETGNGIDIRTLDLNDSEYIGVKMSTDQEVVSFLKNEGLGSIFQTIAYKTANSAGAIGMITRRSKTQEDLISAGRDLERIWIASNAMGLAFQPQSPITLLAEGAFNESPLFSSTERDAILALYQDLQSLLKDSKQTPIFIFRLFWPERQVVRSYRQSLSSNFRRFD